jgi:DNA-binding transcriptional LysR family regulator
VDDRDWDILTGIAEERSLSRVAEKLGISQPAISYRLRSLEEDFGARLCFRTSSGVSLSPQGEYLVAWARDMQRRLEDAKARILGMGSSVCGPLRIGCAAIFANFELPGLLRGFLELYPQVEIFLKTSKSRQIARLLEREDVTVAIVRGDYPWQELRHRLKDEPICLVARSPLALAELPGQPRIVYTTDISLQEMVDAWWRESYMSQPSARMEVDTMDTCRRMVAEGLGWAILPYSGLSEHHGLFTQNLHWADGSALHRSTWIYARHSSLELPAVRAFVDYLVAACATKYGKSPD